LLLDQNHYLREEGADHSPRQFEQSGSHMFFYLTPALLESTESSEKGNFFSLRSLCETSSHLVAATPRCETS